MSPVVASLAFLAVLPVIAILSRMLGRALAGRSQPGSGRPTTPSAPAVVHLYGGAPGQREERLELFSRWVSISAETQRPDTEKFEEDFHAYAAALTGPKDPAKSEDEQGE
jgi:hypothetical protein